MVCESNVANCEHVFVLYKVYKSTADYNSGKALYDRYSAVDDEFLALRKTVLERKTPRRMFVQGHTSVTSKSLIINGTHFTARQTMVVKPLK